MKTNKILICGSGELGSRYLQGLKSCILPLEVNVFDINKRALSLAKRRWEEKEFQGFNHTVSYLSSLNSLKDDMDICIVTTTANNRLDAIKNICASTNVRNWILEKVLVQNSEELKSLLYNLIQSHTEKKMLAFSRPDYVFKVIDPPVISEEKISPQRILIGLLSSFIGVLLYLLYLLVRNFSVKF